MDISKIIADSIDMSVKDVVDGKFKIEPTLDEEISSLSTQFQMLMNYSQTLLKNYHELIL